MSLPRAYRLRRRQDFQLVYQKGRRRAGVYMSVTVLSNFSLPTHRDPITEPLPSRFGIAIGKKVSKRAVVRNRIKRRIKGALRELISQILPGRLVTIVCRSVITECEYDEILRELKKLLVALEVIDGN
jgi:ribonuclease P protein component